MHFLNQRTGQALIIFLGTVFLTIVAVNQPSTEKMTVEAAGQSLAGVSTVMVPNLKEVKEIQTDEVGLKEDTELWDAINQGIFETNLRKLAQNTPETPVNAPRTASNDSTNEIFSSGKLTRRNGVFYGPSGKETYYNLPMGGVIRLLDDLSIEHGEYWVRDDGVKMLGNYIMVATDTRRWPKGTIVETSLGTGRVVDHCGSAEGYSGMWVDIATNW